MADLLDTDFALAEKNVLYRCLDRLVEHKDAVFKCLVRRWGELFDALCAGRRTRTPQDASTHGFSSGTRARS